MKTTYLIPMVTNGETLVLEYKVETCKKDMRLKFCKKNEKYEVNPSTLIRLIGEFKPITRKYYLEDGEVNEKSYSHYVYIYYGYFNGYCC